ncbi:MAG TPA: YraN family protein [Chitinophagaceae bacterium]|nr:YraN family protein [Chitinophagaceae bacterium]
MAQHNEFGKEGEALALEFLRKNDFEILHRNWRYSRYEIDIVAKKQSLLHIIEVKSRHYFPGAFPEESVSKKKFNFLKKAAEEFLFLHPEYKNVQFNILSITLFKDKEPEFFLIQDVFL